MGFKLARAELLLRDYLRYLDTIGTDTITTANAFRATLPPNGASTRWGTRLSVVRVFAKHVHAIDPAHEVPPSGLLPVRSHRAVPYLYSEADIAALMAAARQFCSPLRAATFETLVGLLAVTGMRIGEALRLDRDDVDLAEDVLMIRLTKFGKSRQVPVHASIPGSGSFGTDRLTIMDCTNVEGRAAILHREASLQRPWAILVQGTRTGRALASSVAVANGWDLTGDAIGFEITEDGRLISWKPVASGSTEAPILSRSNVQMATVRPGVLPKRRPRSVPDPTARHLTTTQASRAITIKEHRTDDGVLHLLTAPTVIGVGRGVSPDAYPALLHSRRHSALPRSGQRGRLQISVGFRGVAKSVSQDTLSHPGSISPSVSGVGRTTQLASGIAAPSWQ